MYRFYLILYLVLPTSYCAFLTEQNTTEPNDGICDCHCNIEIGVVASLVNELTNIKERLTAVETHKTQPTTCLEAAASSTKSGIYKVLLRKHSDKPFEVFCEEKYYENAQGGGWTVIQRRVDNSVNFFRKWHEYKVGFGNITGNYWLGLDKLHAFTSSCEHELYISLRQFNRTKTPLYAKYGKFVIGSEAEKYNLTVVGDYEGTAGDALTPHVGRPFSTWDRNNGVAKRNCAEEYMGAWWYYNCYYSNLNGDYKERNNLKGIIWGKIKWSESLKFVQMMIRPTINCVMRLQLKN